MNSNTEYKLVGFYMKPEIQNYLIKQFHRKSGVKDISKFFNKNQLYINKNEPGVKLSDEYMNRITTNFSYILQNTRLDSDNLVNSSTLIIQPLALKSTTAHTFKENCENIKEKYNVDIQTIHSSIFNTSKRLNFI